MPPSAGFVRQHSDAYFAERQNSMGTKAPDKHRDTARNRRTSPTVIQLPRTFCGGRGKNGNQLGAQFLPLLRSMAFRSSF